MCFIIYCQNSISRRGIRGYNLLHHNDRWRRWHRSSVRLLLALWGSLRKLIPPLKNSLIDSTLHEILSFSLKKSCYSIMTRTIFVMHTLWWYKELYGSVCVEYLNSKWGENAATYLKFCQQYNMKDYTRIFMRDRDIISTNSSVFLFYHSYTLYKNKE